MKSVMKIAAIPLYLEFITLAVFTGTCLMGHPGHAALPVAPSHESRGCAGPLVPSVKWVDIVGTEPTYEKAVQALIQEQLDKGIRFVMMPSGVLFEWVNDPIIGEGWLDQDTGLVWGRTLRTKWLIQRAMTYEHAVAACKKQGGRLATKEEYETLARHLGRNTENSSFNPLNCLNPLFPDLAPIYIEFRYWTSSLHRDAPFREPFVFDGQSGNTYSFNRDGAAFKNAARCVRSR